MRAAVCCKGVSIDTTLESVHIVNGDIQFKGSEFYINEFDSYALEAAMALKNKYGIETFALCLGPLRVQEVLYFAIAKEVNHVLRIDGDTNRPELISSGLIPALMEIGPQIILVGVQSEDWMGGEVGVYIAQALNMSLAFAVVEISELTDKSIRIKKELGSGRLAEIILKLPAVLCVQSGIEPLRYVSAARRQKARKTPVKMGSRLNIEEVKQKISGMMAYEAREVSVPPKSSRAEMITGERSEVASKLLEIIGKSV